MDNKTPAQTAQDTAQATDTAQIIPTLNPAQVQELQRLRAYFPYRIIWGEFVGDEFKAYATTTRRAMNKSVKMGNTVYQLTGGA